MQTPVTWARRLETCAAHGQVALGLRRGTTNLFAPRREHEVLGGDQLISVGPSPLPAGALRLG